MANFIQTDYFDSPTRAYPGQLASTHDRISTVIREYPNAADIPMGFGVVVDTPITEIESGSISPYSVKLPTTALDVPVGIAVRPTNPVYNTVDPTDPTKLIAAFQGEKLAAIVGFGTNAIIWVELYETQTITAYLPVYMAFDATNDAGNIPVGAFATDAGGTVGLVLVPGAKWIEIKSVTPASTDRVARIQLDTVGV